MGRVASMFWEREEWIREYEAGESIAEIARRRQISRKSIHKWVARYEEYGAEGLRDLSRAPLHAGQTVEAIWKERVAAVRQEHPQWGAPKLEWALRQRYQKSEVPSISTIGRILKERGLSRGRNKRRRGQGTGELSEGNQANQVWCIDFKGWRRTGDGACCQPLTLTDHATRYLLCCQGLASTRGDLVKPVLERVFEEYGLPERMRSDNGKPFGDTGGCGLTSLSVWWMELGIECERIRPGRPQQNGRHERMHRTLGEQTLNPPAKNQRQQQKRFDEFRQEYNHDRPHEALGQKTPGELYEPSGRAYRSQPTEPEYQRGWVERKVTDRGQMSWNGERIFLSHALSGKLLGLEPVADGLWKVWFHRYWLAEWDERRKKLRHASECKKEQKENPTQSSPTG